MDWLEVSGKSMSPFLEEGDQIKVDWNPTQPNQIGDIVYFQHEGMWLVHRVVRITPTSVITQGDASHCTEVLTMNQIFGKVAEVKNKSKTPLRALSVVFRLIQNQIYPTDLFFINQNFQSLEKSLGHTQGKSLAYFYLFHSEYFKKLNLEIQNHIQEYLHQERIKHFLLEEEAAFATSLLVDAGIRVIALKGIHVAHAYYSHPLMRTMGDVDLLVQPQDFKKAWNILKQAGYFQTEAFFSFRTRCAFARTENGVSIDLHSSIGIDHAFLKSKKGCLSKIHPELEVLSNEDCFLYLFQHGFVTHLVESIYWLTDIQNMMTHAPDFDWSTIQNKIKKYHHEQAFEVMMGLLHHLKTNHTPISPMMNLYYWFLPKKSHIFGYRAWQILTRIRMKDSIPKGIYFILHATARRLFKRILS